MLHSATKALLLVSTLIVGCDSASFRASTRPPALTGQWQYDSSNTYFYDAARHFNYMMSDLPSPHAVLTINDREWNYTGKFSELHSYIRQDDALFIKRIGDTRMAAMHYIKQKQIGQAIGHTDTLRITTLTAHRLVTCDSTWDSDGLILRVSHGYYSR